MTSRQRGAAVLLAVLLAGRILDRFDLPFEAAGPPSAAPPAAPIDTLVEAEAPAARPVPAPPAVAAPPLAINRASAVELERLPGVGPALAARIVAHREAHGPLRTLADLQRVRGIGPRTCARLAPLVRFD